MITAKNGHMCLNCGYAESANPAKTPLVPSESPAAAANPAAVTSTDDSAAVVTITDDPAVAVAATVDPVVVVSEAAKDPQPKTDETKTEPAAVVAEAAPAEDTKADEAKIEVVGVANSLEDQVKRDLAAAIAAVETPTEAAADPAPKSDETKTDEPAAPAEATVAGSEVSASEIIKTKGMSTPDEKPVDGVAPRGRTKGTIDLQPTRHDLVKGAPSAAAVDAIGPAIAAAVAETNAAVPAADASTSEPAAEAAPEATAEPATTVQTSQAETATPVEETPVVHVVDHAAEAEADVKAVEIAALASEAVIEPVAEAETAPDPEPTPVLETPAPVVDAPQEPAVVPSVPALVPTAPLSPVPEAPVSPMPVAVATEAPLPVAEAAPAAPVKAPLIAKTHPEPSSVKSAMMIVGALVIVTLATVAAYYFTTAKSAKKVGQNANPTVDTEVAQATAQPAVLDASTPDTSSAQARDAKRKSDLAAYAATVKAAGSDGFYPTSAPTLPSQLTDPTSGKAYAVSVQPAALGQIQYNAGGQCDGSSITPGRTSTRYIALLTKLEGDPTPYCLNVK